MRTTLDLDDNLLQIAKVRARERGVSLGVAVSDLMRKGLEASARVSSSGFPVFEPPAGAPIVTDELVARYRDDEPDE
jgi:23S rRNA G2445 N2-methylase RlmL